MEEFNLEEFKTQLKGSDSKSTKRKNKLKELIENNDVKGITEFMGEYRRKMYCNYIDKVKTYDAFLAYVGDTLSDKETLRRILQYVGHNNKKIIDYLLKYGINLYKIISLYIDIYGYDRFTRNCTHEINNNQICIRCLFAYKIVTYFITEYNVDIDKLREKYTTGSILHYELFVDILDNLPVDV